MRNITRFIQHIIGLCLLALLTPAVVLAEAPAPTAIADGISPTVCTQCICRRPGLRGRIAARRAARRCCSTAPAAPQKPAVISLFNGRDLDGWTVVQFGGEGEVTVKDGQMILQAGMPITGVKLKRQTPKMNYEVTLEAKRVNGNDFFLALTFPHNENSCSLVIGGWGGGTTGLSTVDFYDASDNDTSSFLDIKSDHWYKVRLRVVEGRIDAWLDGEQIIDCETKDRKISYRIEMEPCTPFGLASFETTAAYRNINLRPLPPPGKESSGG